MPARVRASVRHLPPNLLVFFKNLVGSKPATPTSWVCIRTFLRGSGVWLCGGGVDHDSKPRHGHMATDFGQCPPLTDADGASIFFEVMIMAVPNLWRGGPALHYGPCPIRAAPHGEALATVSNEVRPEIPLAGWKAAYSVRTCAFVDAVRAESAAVPGRAASCLEPCL